MQPIELVYRFDPDESILKPPPATADEARQVLEAGNRRFARWIDSCLSDEPADEPTRFVMQCSPLALGLPTAAGQAAKQEPFAVLLGCADARVPAEVIFGQLRNNLFVVRVAGNVLSEECLGSIEYAVHHLSSIRILVVLGHTNCGAVAAAVDTYLNPWDYLAKVPSPALRSIVDRLFVPVRKAADALKTIWGPAAAQQSGYRTALLETAVAVNVIQSAYNLRLAIEQEGKADLKVVYGIFDLVTQRVWTAPTSDSRKTFREVILADAPATLAEFEELGVRIAVRAAARVGRKT